MKVAVKVDGYKAVGIDATCSKADEMRVMEWFSQSESYLAKLFSPEFRTWAEQQLRNDFTIDLMERYRDESV